MKSAADTKLLGSLAVIAGSVGITQLVAYVAPTSGARDYTLNKLGFFTIGVQWLAFLHASGIFGNERTEKYYDLTGSVTFVLTLALSLYCIRGKITPRRLILSLFVGVWSIRLGWFLFSRIRKNRGIDSRFVDIKKSAAAFLCAWTLQGVWV